MSVSPQAARLLQQGEDAVHAGRFGEGEAIARRVLGGDPNAPRAHYVLAISALFQQRPADALPSLERAMALDRADSQYPFTQGVALAGLGRVEEAIAAYRRALELRPMFFEARANVASLLEGAKRHAEAVEEYARALKLRPDVVLVLNGMGVCLVALGRHDEAVRHLQRAVSLRPDFAAGHNNLANAYLRLKQGEKAIAHLRRAVEIRPDFADAWVSLGEQLYMAGRDGEALPSLDRALALEPGNGTARYLREAIAGGRLPRAPDAFVRDFFDRFAPDFERRLTGDLGYRTPEVLAQFLEPVLADRGRMRIADLGCGTGLSGAVLRPHATRLVGADLSPGMLAHAKQRGVYDELHEMEIVAFLASRAEASFDLVTAVDVFVYVGDLDAVFREARRVLAVSGLFAFSVEALGEGGEGYRLARTGRYAHAAPYVRELAASGGFRLLDERDTVLRQEEGRPVAGRLFLLEKA